MDSLKGHIAKHVSKHKKQLYFPNKGFSVRGSDLLPPCLNKSVTSVCTCTESLMIHAEWYFDILKHHMNLFQSKLFITFQLIYN